jgi:hypothetical protein
VQFRKVISAIVLMLNPFVPELEYCLLITILLLAMNYKFTCCFVCLLNLVYRLSGKKREDEECDQKGWRIGRTRRKEMTGG